MGMSISVTMNDDTCIHVRASGDYAPDVMHDLQNRAAELMRYAASLSLTMIEALDKQANETPDEIEAPE